MKEVNPMKITFEEGSTQVIKPTEKFDGDYKALAREIARGSKHTFEILADDNSKSRKRK
jgi:hypothetical protein